MTDKFKDKVAIITGAVLPTDGSVMASRYTSAAVTHSTHVVED